MAIMRFTYKLANGSFQPVITIGVKLENDWQRVDLYVDSGAACSVINSRFAKRYGFDYRSGRRTSL